LSSGCINPVDKGDEVRATSRRANVQLIQTFVNMIVDNTADKIDEAEGELPPSSVIQ
jgi:F0F1-type ATP synthase alpha subunit